MCNPITVWLWALLCFAHTHTHWIKLDKYTDSVSTDKKTCPQDHLKAGLNKFIDYQVTF